MRPRASLAAARRGATLTLALAGTAPLAGVLTILLALACGRTPERPGAGPAKGDAPPLTAAEGHLARGEEARERAEYARARDELEKARALFEKDRDWEGCVRAWIGVGAVTARQVDYEAALGILDSALAARQDPAHQQNQNNKQSCAYLLTFFFIEDLLFCLPKLSLSLPICRL